VRTKPIPDHLPSLADPAVVAGLVREFLRGAVDRVADVGAGVLGGGAAGFADVEACPVAWRASF
jgi:hypothetical protein